MTGLGDGTCLVVCSDLATWGDVYKIARDGTYKKLSSDW
jgi:hypothetical protein